MKIYGVGGLLRAGCSCNGLCLCCAGLFLEDFDRLLAEVPFKFIRLVIWGGIEDIPILGLRFRLM